MGLVTRISSRLLQAQGWLQVLWNLHFGSGVRCGSACILTRKETLVCTTTAVQGPGVACGLSMRLLCHLGNLQPWRGEAVVWATVAGSAALSDGPCAGLGQSRGGSPCFTDRQLQLREVECLPQATQGVSGKTNLNGGLPPRTDEANHGFEAALGRPAGFLTDAPACFLGCSWRACVCFQGMGGWERVPVPRGDLAAVRPASVCGPARRPP